MTAARPRDGERTREAVLDAAERVFARDGWDGASLAAIGAEAGVSRGTPGYFFGSKEGLRQAMIRRLVEAARAEMVAGPGTPGDRLAVLMTRQLALAVERPALARAAGEGWCQGMVPGTDGMAELQADLVRMVAGYLETVPAARQPVEPAGAAAVLVGVAWSAGLVAAPGGATDSTAALADRRSTVVSLVRLLAGAMDGNGKDLERDDDGSEEDGGIPSLPASKLRPWRLPGMT